MDEVGADNGVDDDDVDDDDDLDNIVVVIEDREAENQLEEENILFVLDDSVPEDDQDCDNDQRTASVFHTDGTADDALESDQAYETVYEEDLGSADVDESCAGTDLPSISKRPIQEQRLLFWDQFVCKQ